MSVTDRQVDKKVKPNLVHLNATYYSNYLEKDDFKKVIHHIQL